MTPKAAIGKTIPTLEPTSEIAEITPQMAREWLEKDVPQQRCMKAHVVDAYARDMRAGRWSLNGDPIRFDVDGNLIAGQHRLHAIIEADVSVKSFVVRRVPVEALITLDSGIKRTMGDELTFRAFVDPGNRRYIRTPDPKGDSGRRRPSR
jgi:hypothetical protein